MCVQDIETTVNKLGKLHMKNHQVTSNSSGRCWSSVDKQLNDMFSHDAPIRPLTTPIRSNRQGEKSISAHPSQTIGSVEVECNLPIRSHDGRNQHSEWLAPLQETLWIDVRSVCVTIGNVVTTIPLLPGETTAPVVIHSESDDETDKEDLSVYGL